MKNFYTDGKLGGIDRRALRKRLESLGSSDLKKLMGLMKVKNLGQLLSSDKEELSVAISKLK